MQRRLAELRDRLMRPQWRAGAFALCMVMLAIAAVSRTTGGLAPDALYLDDQWVAVLVQHASLSELISLAPPAPIGFVILLKAVTMCIGYGEWQLQALPFALGLAQIPLLGWIAWRATGRLSLGVVAAGLHSGRPFLVSTLRVKQYTLEGFIALALLALTIECVRRPRPLLFGTLIVAAIIALPFSFTAVPVGLVIVNALALHLMWRERRGMPDSIVSRGCVGLGCAAYNAIVLLWLFALPLRQPNETMYNFWADHYIPVHSVEAFVSFWHLYGSRLFIDAMPWMLGWVALLVPVGIALLLSRRSTRMIGLAFLGFYAGMFAASAVGVYPIGGWRTDVFSYPITILAIIGALYALSRAIHWLPYVPFGAVVLYFIFVFPGAPVGYPMFNGRSAIEAANQHVQPNDALIVTPQAVWLVGCYGRWPIALQRVHDSSNGYIVIPDHPHTLVLREAHVGRSAGDGADEALAQQLDDLLEDGRRVVLLSNHFWSRSDRWVIEAIESRGYQAQQIVADDGTLWILDSPRLPSIRPMGVSP